MILAMIFAQFHLSGCDENVDYFNEIVGTVKDRETGEPIDSVTVYVTDLGGAGRDSVTVTDEAGKYVVGLVGKEPYRDLSLEFRKERYRFERRPMSYAKWTSGGTFTLNITMKRIY
jgi:hypothetical protein